MWMQALQQIWTWEEVQRAWNLNIWQLLVHRRNKLSGWTDYWRRWDFDLRNRSYYTKITRQPAYYFQIILVIIGGQSILTPGNTFYVTQWLMVNLSLSTSIQLNSWLMDWLRRLHSVYVYCLTCITPQHIRLYTCYKWYVNTTIVNTIMHIL